MIDSIDRIEVVKSQDLPQHFRMMIGTNVLSFTREGIKGLSNRIYFHLDGNDESIYFERNDDVAILIEDSLDNPVTYAEILLALS